MPIVVRPPAETARISELEAEVARLNAALDTVKSRTLRAIASAAAARRAEADRCGGTDRAVFVGAAVSLDHAADIVGFVFEHVVGRAEAMGMIRNVPSPEGEEMGRHLARFHRAEAGRLKAVGADVPEPCKTCAFREGTVPNRCLATVADALKSAVEGQEFSCHESPEVDGELTGVCLGWAVLATSAIVRAAVRGERVELPYDYVGGVDKGS